MAWEVQVCLLVAPTTPIATVPYWESFQFEEVLSDVGAGHVVMYPEDCDPLWLDENVIWRFVQDDEVRGGFLLETVEDLEVTEDEQHRIKIAGRGFGQVLEWAVVYPGNFPVAPKVERVWTGRSYPDVLHLFLTEAQNRDTLGMLDISSWGVSSASLADSDGQAWGTLVDGNQKAGENLLALTKRWAGLHPFDWYIATDFKMHAWKLAGSDKSSTVVFHPGGSVLDQQVTRARRELKNVYLIQRTDQGVQAFENETSIAQWGRREAYLQPSEAIDPVSAGAIADPLVINGGREQVERVVKVDQVEGRIAWVDFGLGDFVGVEYDEGIFSHRCVGIAVGVDSEGNEAIEAVLGDIISPEQGDTSVSGGGGGGGSNLIIAILGADTTFTSATSQSVMPLDVEALAPTNGRAGLNIQGVMTGTGTITLEVLFDTLVAATFKQVLTAGDQNIAMPFILRGIPESVSVWRIRVTMSAGSLFVKTADASWWIESPDLAGGDSGQNPDQVINEAVTDAPVSFTDGVTLWIEEPGNQLLSLPPSEAVLDEPVLTTDAQLAGLAIAVTPPADTDDGWTSDSPSFTSIGPQLQAGNQAGEIRSTFIRFVLPYDIDPQDVIDSALRLMPDTNAIVAPKIRIYAALDPAAPAPTTRDEFNLAVKTTAFIDWEVPATAGTLLTTPDLTPLIDEVIAQVGATNMITLYLIDNASPAGAYHAWRSFAHTTGPKPTLLITLG